MKNTNTQKKPFVQNQSNNFQGIDMGRLPPQSIDVEEAVLGAVMLEKDAYLSISDILKPDCFYKDSHAKIYKAVLDISQRHEPVDVLTVAEELKKNGSLEDIGGAVYLVVLTNKIVSAAHVEIHARIVAQKYIQRELIRVTTEIQQKAYDDSNDVVDLLDFSEAELFKVAEGHIKKEVSEIKDLIQKALKQIEAAGLKEDGLSGVPSGFTNIDRITSGWQRSDLIIIAARPSMGKTAFVLSMARNIAVEHKKPIAVFSLEMSSVQLVTRLIVSETELAAEKIRNGRLSKDEWNMLEQRIKKLIDAPIFIDDTPAISLFELRAKCRRLKAQHNIDLIVIDYLQLMTLGTDNKGNREQEVSMISRSLKAIAKELDVPVIALSQLNRSVETRHANKRPQLSDLRESGAIEQDADIVIFIHRPEKYGITEDEDGNSTHGLAQIIIAKHRNGSVEDVNLRFRQEFARFEDIEAIDIDSLSGDNKGYVYQSKMNVDVEKTNSFNGNSLPQNRGFDDNAPF